MIPMTWSSKPYLAAIPRSFNSTGMYAWLAFSMVAQRRAAGTGVGTAWAGAPGAVGAGAQPERMSRASARLTTTTVRIGSTLPLSSRAEGVGSHCAAPYGLSAMRCFAEFTLSGANGLSMALGHWRWLTIVRATAATAASSYSRGRGSWTGMSATADPGRELITITWSARN